MILANNFYTIIKQKKLTVKTIKNFQGFCVPKIKNEKLKYYNY